MTKNVTGNHAPRNRSVRLSAAEEMILHDRVLRWQPTLPIESLVNRTLQGDSLEVSQWLPDALFDLVIADPPYNLAKGFRSTSFRRLPRSEYLEWLERWISQMRRLLKPTGTLYVCGDWQSSGIIQEVCERYFLVRNRITWEREKGRGAQKNWKNCAEDIWFCTASDDYYFDVEAVKLRRRVVAPYRDSDGSPRDLGRDRTGRFSHHLSIRSLDGRHRAVLVDAGKHGAPNSKTGEIDREIDPCKFPSRRSCVRPVLGLRNDFRCCEETRP